MRPQLAALTATFLLGYAVGVIELGTPVVVGGAGFGYTFSVADGNGNVILATNPVGDHPTVIIKSPFGSSGEPSGPDSGQAALLKNKGTVTCGCVASVDGTQYLFAGLSASGYILQVNLSFPIDAVSYLNVTDSSLLWNEGPPQAAVSAVCLGRYVYFGTKSPSTSSTVLRLDTTDPNPATRFMSLGPIVSGDLRRGAVWGENSVIFAVEPDGDTPLTFVVIQTTDGVSSVQMTSQVPWKSLSGFDEVSGIWADGSETRVLVANGNGVGRIALIDLTLPSAPLVTQQLLLDDVGLSHITSFVVDAAANFLYVTVGDCEATGDVAMVAVRLVPTLTKEEIFVAANSDYDCTARGVPTVAVLAPSEDSNKVYVYSEVQASSSDFIRDGIVLPYTVYPSNPCPAGCHNASGHGQCAGGRCYCSNAFSGDACDQPVPCGGSNCSGHGQCVGGVCECTLQYSGAFCDRFLPCPLNCSSRGVCSVQHGCQCANGYVGVACELVTGDCHALNSCSGHGTCVLGYPQGTCVCDTGFFGDDCSIANIPCPANCSGNGLCMEGVCQCSDTWEGIDCSIVATPCPNNCSAHGYCKAGRCTCYLGFKGLDCGSVDNSVCAGGCNGHGSCVKGACVCSSGWRGRNCTIAVSDLRVAYEAIFIAGENQATASFVSPSVANEVVFCLASNPGSCVALAGDTLTRSRQVTFDNAPLAMLLEDAEGTTDTQAALLPESLAISSVSLVETSATAGPGLGPISVAVVDAFPSTNVILGTKLTTTGTMHGQLVRMSTLTLQLSAQLTFDDDIGRGVSAGIAAGDGTFFFASGNNPAMIYRVDSNLQIVARSPLDAAPLGEVSVLLFDDNSTLIAATGSILYVYKVSASSIEPFPGSATIVLPSSFGSVTCGFVDYSVSPPAAYVGTSGSPGGLVAISLASPAPSFVGSMRLRAGENTVTTAVFRDDTAFLGLASDPASKTCQIVKVSVSALREMETVTVDDCASDLVSASIAADGSYAYFGNAASPAHVYNIRLIARSRCPGDCSNRGSCVEGTCSCEEGWTGDACNVQISPCPNNCSHVGECIQGVCVCINGYFGADCSVILICSEKCQHGTCTGPSNTWPCACESTAWGGPFCDDDQLYCPNECSNNGACVSGACVCNAGFGGVDCSTMLYPPPAQRGCQKDVDCGTHGICVVIEEGSGRCMCADGWAGIDCDVDIAFEEAIETNKLTPPIIALIVVGCVLFGMVVGASIYKSWLAKNAAAEPADGAAASAAKPSKVQTGAYTRLPRRLVK